MTYAKDLSKFPQRLKDLRRWVVYSGDDTGVPDPKRPGKTKLDKTPKQSLAPDFGADVTDPKTWSSFEEATASSIHEGRFKSGVGIVLGEIETGVWLVGLDGDQCHKDGLPTEAWGKMVEGLLPSYTEFSPNFDGYHSLWLSDVGPEKGARKGKFEFYPQEHYFTVTGAQVGDDDLGWLPKDQAKALMRRVKSQQQEAGKAKGNPRLSAKSKRLLKGDTDKAGDDSACVQQLLVFLLADARLDEALAEEWFKTSVYYTDPSSKWCPAHPEAKWERLKADEMRKAKEIAATLQAIDTSDRGLADAFIDSDPPLRYTDAGVWLGYESENGLWVKRETPVYEVSKFISGLVHEDMAPGTKRLLRSASATRSAVYFVQSDHALRIKEQDFDPDAMVLGLPDGLVLDLRTGETRVAKFEDLITKRLPFRPEGRCQRWEEFMEEAHPEDPEISRFLQRYLGYCLTAKTNEDMLMFFIGPGGAGKGTTMDAVMKILGPYGKSPDISLFLEETKEERRMNYIAELLGVRLALCNEGSKLKRLDKRALAKLTGGGVLQGRRLNQQPFDFTQTHKVIIMANDNPLLDVDSAMRRRICVVPFNQAFGSDPGKVDKNLRDWFQEPEQCKAIFQWLVDGYLKYQELAKEKAGGLRPPSSVLQNTADYFEDQDLYQQFISQYVEIGPEFWQSTVELFRAWESFCKATGHRGWDTVGTEHTFNPAIRSRIPGSQKRRKTFGSSKIWGVQGLRLTEAGMRIITEEREHHDDYRD